MSFSPIIRVRKLLDKMKTERESPRLKRFPSRTSSSIDLAEKPKIDTSSIEYLTHIHPSSSSTSSCGSKDSKTSFRFVDSQEISEESSQSLFSFLPSEAVLLVFSFLQPEDLRCARLVSHEWGQFADDELNWKALCFDHYLVDSIIVNTWRETYYHLDRLFAEGNWEGMSKWVEPDGFDNEQKTTAKLQFFKRRNCGVKSPSPSKHVTRGSSLGGSIRLGDTLQVNNVSQEPQFLIKGTGITINCSSPSPFKIEGERTVPDSTGCAFTWKKLFDNHTSVYTGRIDYLKCTVSGEISYHDGTTHWKGVFFYSRKSNQKGLMVNA